MEEIVSLCKRRGFIFPGSEVYGGFAGTWDFGPLGVMLKRNIMNEWWGFFVDARDEMFGVDAAILMNPKVWEASGHTATFADPLVECKKCHGRFRADKIAEGINESVTTEDFLNLHVKCPICGEEDWGPIRKFNMMFTTHVGAVLPEDLADTGSKELAEKSIAYLRPETAQGIFTNYKNVVDTLYPDLPFGLAQQGKSFRNEISPRDFILRDRECSQMEIEYFVRPDEWESEFEKMVKLNDRFLSEKMGLSKYRHLEVAEEDRAHYSKRTIDYMFEYPNGEEELMGLAYRTDFDLSNIQRATGKSMEYRDKRTGESFVPHVIEPSIGVERLVLAVLATAYFEEELPSGEKRTVLRLPENLAPYKFCVSPLLKNKPDLVEKAQEVYDKLREKYTFVTWDDSGNIGKRYRKQDEIGTPKCIVVDFTTLEDNTVTVRDRDTTEQIRVAIDKL